MPAAADAADNATGSVGWLAPEWFRRHALLSLIGGVGLGTLGQLLVFATARGVADATVLQRLLALFCSTLVWLTLGFAVAWLGQRLIGNKRGRWVALVLSATVFASLTTLVVCGVGLRIMSGSYLTAGALVFLANSSEHFVHGAFGEYAGTALSIVGTLFITLALCVAGLRRSARPSPTPKRFAWLAAVAAVFLVLVYSARSRVRFLGGLPTAGPLIALAGSFDEDFELKRTSARPDALNDVLAPPGPPLSAEQTWRDTLPKLQTKPNIIVVMLESVTPRHMSGYGYERPTTPELDRLARGGLWWKRAWTTATHSNYAQMAVLSSLFPRRGYGLDQYTDLSYPRYLWHDMFHTLGYATATVSSQDENWQGMLRFQKTETPTFFWFSDDFTGKHLDSGVEKVVPDDATTDEAIKWLATQKDPWALYVNFQATHFPYSTSDKAPKPYKPDEPTWSTFNYLGFPRGERDIVINRYDNALLHVDTQLGRLRKHLEDSGQFDNTLWIITSDHGEMFFEKDLVTHGKTLYQLEAHVPLILHWPARITPEVRDEPVSNLDALPTALDFLGVPPHPSWQGRSLRKLDEDGIGKNAIFMNIQGLRTADAVICWPYKLIIDRTSNQPFLFNLNDDADENDNLIEKQPEVAKRLNDALSKQLIAQMDYYGSSSKEREQRFQPRLRRCPKLPQ